MARQIQGGDPAKALDATAVPPKARQRVPTKRVEALHERSPSKPGRIEAARVKTPGENEPGGQKAASTKPGLKTPQPAPPRRQKSQRARGADGNDLLSRRGTFFDKARQYTPMVAVETGVGTFVVSTGDTHIGRSLFVKQGRGELKSLARGIAVLKDRGMVERARAGTFLDVGANIGTSTVPAVGVHGFARALALEPEPRNLHLLQINIAVNDLADRVQTLHTAASSEPGTAKLVVAKTRSGVHEIAVDGNSERKDHLIDVELVTVDSLVDSGMIPGDGTGMIWIDCEGHDGHVLAGASKLLAAGVPVILEVSPSKLDKQGGRDLLVDAANTHYSSFIDMRRMRGEAGSSKDLDYRPMRISRLADLIGKYAGASAGHTELMLIRDE
jgi:FkbM family methyltransferase